MKVYRTMLGLAVVNILYTIALLVKDGKPGELSWWFFIGSLCVWICLPFVLLLSYARKHQNQVASSVIAFLAMIFCVFGGFWILWQCFFVSPSALGGVIFFFLPFYQLIVVAIGITIAKVVGRGQVGSKLQQEKDTSRETEGTHNTTDIDGNTGRP